MIINNITIDDLVGVEFFRFSNSHPLDFDKYFSCVKSMRSLFENPDFKDSTSGFYINYITNSEEGNSVRLTYFTKNGKKTKEAINNFQNTNRSNIILFRSSDRKEPHASRVSSGYGGEELRFRKFLNAYTQIGLDLLENFGRLCTRRLVATYRFDCHPHTPEWVIRPKPFFEPVFNKHSEFFRELNDGYFTEQLWEDLERAERGSRGVWFHYFVNMLLPGDWNEYGYVIPEESKKRMLESKRLDVPEDWKLDCEI